MVKSQNLYSAQNYLCAVTGFCYRCVGDSDIEFIEKILRQHNLDYWSYPLSEIDHIVCIGLNVVLVDCVVYNRESEEYDHQYRWFEVPEDFKDEG